MKWLRGRRRFNMSIIISEKENEYLNEIENKCNYSKNNIVSFEDDEMIKYGNLIKQLCLNRVLRNLEIDGADAYQYIGGNNGFEAFREIIEIKKSSYISSNNQSFQKNHKQYDVFISHASKDKSDYVDQLNVALRRLGVSVFYDTDIISWGDNWKKTILDGTAASEFAIIVISENFFDREWTERELKEFMQRQNDNNQKIVLPLLHNVTIEQFKNKYPELEEIQAIQTQDYNMDQIVILFAKELLKRYKGVS